MAVNVISTPEHRLKVIWIEPIPEVFQRLVENIHDLPDQRAINALITNEDGTLCTLHISNNSGASSSILELHLHKDIWPEVTRTHDIVMRSSRLPTALANVDLAQYDAMVLDTQGSELLIYPRTNLLGDESADRMNESSRRIEWPATGTTPYRAGDIGHLLRRLHPLNA